MTLLKLLFDPDYIFLGLLNRSDQLRPRSSPPAIRNQQSTKTVANGDLSRTVDVDVQGEMLQSKSVVDVGRSHPHLLGGRHGGYHGSWNVVPDIESESQSVVGRAG